MNKLIEDIKNKSIGVSEDGEVDLNIFATLIISECTKSLKPMLRDMISRSEAVTLIYEHFGDKSDIY